MSIHPIDDQRLQHGAVICGYAVLLFACLYSASVIIIRAMHASDRFAPAVISLCSAFCAAFVIFRLRRLQAHFRVREVPVVWGTAIVFSLFAILSLVAGMDMDNTDLAVSKSLTIEGRVLRVGMTSDEAFQVLLKDEDKGPPETKPDPDLEDSLIVVHHYVVGARHVAVEFKRRKYDGPYIVSSIFSGDQVGAHTAPKSFDVDTTNVGANFKGADIAAITEEIRSATTQDEFESTAEYQARFAAFRGKPLFDLETLDGYVPFVQQPGTLGYLDNLHGASVAAYYDADKQVLSVTPHIGFKDPAPIIGGNGPGLDVKGHFTDPKPFTVTLRPERAKKLKYNLNIMFVCKLGEPWIVRKRLWEPTIAGPPDYDFYLLEPNSVQVWIYDTRTGEVLQKQALTPLRSSNRSKTP